MDKRYQVFVSSAYEDLQDERRAVMQALLEMGCIPSGMELFPAADEDQWNFIKGVIQDCDYYIIILGGRYGSVAPSGLGYTEMEYRYALEIKKPTIAFLHKAPNTLPANRTERLKKGQKLFSDFESLLKQRLCKYWNNADDLSTVVTSSLVALIRKNPGTGWVRASEASDPAELLRLRSKIDELEITLSKASNARPAGTEDLAQGDAVFKIVYDYSLSSVIPKIESDLMTGRTTAALTWEQIIKASLPQFLGGGDKMDLMESIKDLILAASLNKHVLSFGVKRCSANVHVSDKVVTTVLVQLHALGLIMPASKRSAKAASASADWNLTPYGESYLSKVCAIRIEGLRYPKMSL